MCSTAACFYIEICSVANAEYYYEEIQNEIKTHLMALADDACSYSHNER
jgi:hypothetical protein